MATPESPTPTKTPPARPPASSMPPASNTPPAPSNWQPAELPLVELTGWLGGFCWASEQFDEHGQAILAAGDTPVSAFWQPWVAVHQTHVELWRSLLPDSPALQAESHIQPLTPEWQAAIAVYHNPLSATPAAPTTGSADSADTHAPADTHALTSFELLATNLLLGQLTAQLASLRLRLLPVAAAPELRVTRQIIDDWSRQADATILASQAYPQAWAAQQNLTTLASGPDIAAQINQLAQVVIFQTPS